MPKNYSAKKPTLQCSLLLALICCVILTASSRSNAATPFEDAQLIFSRAEDGDTALIKSAEQKFAELLKTEPGNPVYQAYHGSAVAQMAYTTLLPWKKHKWVKEGLTELDAMLKGLNAQHESMQLRGAPMLLEAKLVAAGTFIRVPRLYGRFDDGAKLLAEVQQAQSYPTSPSEFRGAVLLRVAEMHDEEGHATLRQQNLTQALALDKKLAATTKAQELLHHTSD